MQMPILQGPCIVASRRASAVHPTTMHPTPLPVRPHGPRLRLCAPPYCSAYRLSPFHISVVGFGATAMREKRYPESCTWVWRNGSWVAGELKVRLSIMNYNKVVSPEPPGIIKLRMMIPR